MSDGSADGSSAKSRGSDAALFKALLIALVFSLSFTLIPLHFSVSPLHAALAYGDLPVIVLMALLVALARLFHGGRYKAGVLGAFLPLYGLLIWWGISGLLRAQNQSLFLASWLQYALGGILILAAPWMLVRYRLVEFAMDAILIGAAGVSATAFLEAALRPSGLFEDITGSLGANHAHIGLYMMVAMAVALHRAGGKGGWWPITVAVLAFVTILISGSRASAAGSIPILGVYCFRRLSFINFVRLAAGAAVVAVVFLYINKQREFKRDDQQFEIAKGVTVDKSAGRRLLMWMVSWRVITSSSDHFMFGVGFTNFRWEYGRSIKLPFYTNAAHNVFIHVWTETGLLGLTLYTVMFGWMMIFAWRRRKEDPDVAMLPALCIGILGTGMTQETMYPNEAMCNFNVLFFFAAMLMALHARQAPFRGLPPVAGSP